MKYSFLISICLLTFISILNTSCVRKKFDAPPDASSYDPMLPVNTDIWTLKGLYSGGQPELIEDDITISGIVTADDRSGAFYKQIIIQDSSSGIAVKLDRNGLYADFPIGRRVYIKCKGLYIGAYGGFVQLGYLPDFDNSLSDLPSALIAKHVIKGSTGHTVTPRTVSIQEIMSQTSTNVKWIGTLIKIDSTEFIPEDVFSTYAADPNVQSGVDRTIEDCVGKKVILRMSSYSTFRSELIPAGRGPLTAIYSVYNSTMQLLIRDTNDVKFYGPRCGGQVITQPTRITIDSLRKMYTTGTVILGSYSLSGTVISDALNKNITTGVVVLQDESQRGINLYFGGSGPGFALGDSITVNVLGNELKVYNGTLEVVTSSARAKKVGKGNVIPQTVTIQQLNADSDNPVYNQRKYESVLVRIANCTISGSPATYSGNRTLTDGTGTITLRTSSSALFANENYPTGTLSYLTAICNRFNTTNQVLMRRTSDITP